MKPEAQQRSWLALTIVHARWVLRTNWRNGEQLLLLVGIPLAAFVALTRTDLLSSTTPALVVTTAIIVLAAGFTSPAISLAFERRYGSFAFLGTTPLPRSAIIGGTLTAIVASALAAVAVVLGFAVVLEDVGSLSLPTLLAALIIGLWAVVPWAFVLGGTARSETVLVLANGLFVLATLFGGVLVPATSLPYGFIVTYLPPGAIVEFATHGSLPSAVALLVWGALGLALASRSFRWR